MALVPFIYFSLLTYYLWNKHKALDICVYMSGLYAFTSLCSAVIVLGDMLDTGGVLYDRWNVELNIIPTIVYCIIHTICILPFSLIYKKDLKEITPAKTGIVDYVSWVLIIVAFINLYAVADSTMDILSGDLKEIRTAHYMGEESPATLKIQTLPYFIQVFFYLKNSTILALPIFFYYLCFGLKSWWYKAILFLTSLTVPIASLQEVDRTEPLFYIQMLLFCFIFFWDMMSKKIKRIMMVSCVPLLALVITYMTAVSMARFDDRDGGTMEKTFQYAGQNYVNFCYFWENHNPSYIETEREFPFINHYLFNVDSNNAQREERSGRQGFYISVFPTYLGDILLDLNEYGLAIWVICFFVITAKTIKRAHRNSLDVGDVVSIFVLGVIPVFGIFYYKYYHYNHTIMFIVTFFIYFFSKNKIKLYTNDNIHNNSDMERNETQLDSQVS